MVSIDRRPGRGQPDFKLMHSTNRSTKGYIKDVLTSMKDELRGVGHGRETAFRLHSKELSGFQGSYDFKIPVPTGQITGTADITHVEHVVPDPENDDTSQMENKVRVEGRGETDGLTINHFGFDTVDRPSGLTVVRYSKDLSITSRRKGLAKRLAVEAAIPVFATGFDGFAKVLINNGLGEEGRLQRVQIDREGIVFKLRRNPQATYQR